MVLLDTLVRLAENIKQYLELSQVEVLCRLVECLITAIDVQKKGIDLVALEHGNNPDEKLSTPYKWTDIPAMLPFFKKQLAFVESFMKARLSYNIAEWNLELQVSNCLEI